MKQIKTFSGHNRELVEREANTWVLKNKVKVVDFKFEDKGDELDNFYEIAVIYEI